MDFIEFLKMVDKTVRAALSTEPTGKGFVHSKQSEMSLHDAAVVWQLYNMQEKAEKWFKRLSIVGIILSIIVASLSVLQVVC